MKKNIALKYLLAFVFLCSALLIEAQEATSWKQFRGDNRDGQSIETGLLEKWPTEGLEQVWKIQLGEGFSEVLIEGSICYNMHSVRIDSISGDEYMAAFDASTGKKIWDTKIDSLFIDPDDWGDGPRSTPAIDDKNIYCLSSYGKFFAISKKDGKIIWKVDLINDYGSQLPRWAYSSSPIIIDDVLIMETGGTENKGFTAFDKSTGEAIWTKGTATSGYCSPTVATINGQKQIVFANGPKLISFKTNGDTLWSFNMPIQGATAMPLFMAPNKFFLSSVSRIGGFVAEINDNKATQLVTSTSLKNNWSSSCYYEGHIYGFDNATFKCVTADSLQTKWVKRGFGKGSLILADKKLYVLSDKGKLILVDTKPDAYTELSSFQAIEGKSWTAPSIANGRIYLRNLTEMACYKLK